MRITVVLFLLIPLFLVSGIDSYAEDNSGPPAAPAGETLQKGEKEGAIHRAMEGIEDQWRKAGLQADAPPGAVPPAGVSTPFDEVPLEEQEDIKEAGTEAEEAYQEPFSAEVEKKEIEYEEREGAEGEPFIRKRPLEEEMPLSEEPEEQALPIVADADSVEFDREQNTITGTGNAVVRYKEVKLTADKITVYMETGDTYAEGNVSLFEEGQFFTGKNVRYNFRTGEANITDCHAYVQPWYGYGKIVRRISKDEYQIENGYVTTCDYPKPHTSMRAKRIYLYPGDSIIAHNVVFNLYETPVFWLPYTKYSLIDDESPYNLVPGFSSDWGFFLLSSFDIYKTKYVRLTPMVDFRSKRGIGVGATVDYDLPSAKAYGETIFYITHDNDPDYTLNSDLDLKNRYRVTLEHGQEFSEDTQMWIKFNKQSDEDFINEFFRGEYEDDIQRENYIDITKAEQNYQLTLRAEPRFNKFYNVVQRLPEFRVEVVNQRVGETPFFYESRTALTNFDMVFSDDPLTADDVDNGLPEPPIMDPIKSLRMDTFHEFSYPKKYFKFLNLNPFAGIRQTFYSKAPTETPTQEGTGVFIDTDLDGIAETEQVATVPAPIAKNVWRGLFNLGIQSDMKVWKVWDYYNKEMKINKLRHLFQPTLTYQFYSKPTRTFADQVYDFDEFDFFNELSMFTLELRNALQTQRGEGQNVDIFDIKVYLDMVTNNGRYLGFEHRQFADEHYSVAEIRDGFNKVFNDLFIDAEFRPIDWVKLDFEIYYRLDPARLDEWNTDFYIYRNDIISWAVGQRYLVDDSNLWTTEFNLQLNDDWAARTFLRFETADGMFEEGEWSLFRDLHEWEAAFTVRYRGRRKSDVGFFVLLYLDAYPDIPVETRF